MKKVLFLITPLSLLFLFGCVNDSAYTLYRNSVTDENMRIHIATFNTDDNEAYNRENCDLAAKLFQSQKGVKTKFWCEKGAYKR